MVAEDPSFRVESDEESGDTILKGMGELHLDIKVDILKRTHGVEVTVGKPQVAYRETIKKQITDVYTHKKQSVVPVNTPRLNIPLSLGTLERGMSSNPRSSEATFLVNSGQPWKRVSNFNAPKEPWLNTHSSI